MDPSHIWHTFLLPVRKVTPNETYLLPRQGSLSSWSHSEPVQPGWHSQMTLVFSRERQIPCLQMLQDLQPGRTPTDWCGSSLKSWSSLLIRTSWIHPWKPLGVLSVPCRNEDSPVDVGIPAKEVAKCFVHYLSNSAIFHLNVKTQWQKIR